MSNKNFLDVYDVANYMGISISKVYKVIKQLNNQLKKPGYITIAGRVSRKDFEEKVFSAA